MTSSTLPGKGCPAHQCFRLRGLNGCFRRTVEKRSLHMGHLDSMPAHCEMHAKQKLRGKYAREMM